MKLCDRIDNVIDARDRDERFLHVNLNDDLIEILRDRANRDGYGTALEEPVTDLEQLWQ